MKTDRNYSERNVLAEITRRLEDCSSREEILKVFMENLSRLRDMYEKQKELADRDPLTGLLNHRRLHEVLDQEINRASRSRSTFAMILLDVDDFKIINDTYGHVQGDKILRHIASILEQNTRSMDHLGRYGGDEFMFILPETDGVYAHIVATRIVDELAQQGIMLDNDTQIPLHISVGIAVYPSDASNIRDLVECADRALYRSKNQEGFNVVTLAHSMEIKRDEFPSLNVLEELTQVVDRKDHYTRLHSDIVCQYCERMANKLKLKPDERDILIQAALIHDVGKIIIPTSILRKPGNLSEEEYDIIKKHPVFGHSLLKPLTDLDPLIQEIVLYHHERVDGRGYPAGLKGDGIPFLARVLSVCDVYSAMVIDRPYRKGFSTQDALKGLKEASGTQLDGDLVDIFVSLHQFDWQGEKAKGVPRVMVIDDDFSIMGLIQEVLRLEPYTIDVFSKSDEAMKALDHVDYHVVLTDINMPVISGWEIVERVKGKDTQVIVMTALQTPELASALEEGRIFAALIKPFNILEVKNKILAALQRSAP